MEISDEEGTDPVEDGEGAGLEPAQEHATSEDRPPPSMANLRRMVVDIGRGKSQIFYVPTDPVPDESQRAHHGLPSPSPSNGEAAVSRSPPDVMDMSDLQAALEDARIELKARELAQELAKGDVIPVDESLPYGKDNADTLDIPAGEVENLMNKFNQVSAELELVSKRESEDVPWPTGLNVKKIISVRC